MSKAFKKKTVPGFRVRKREVESDAIESHRVDQAWFEMALIDAHMAAKIGLEHMQMFADAGKDAVEQDIRAALMTGVMRANADFFAGHTSYPTMHLRAYHTALRTLMEIEHKSTSHKIKQETEKLGSLMKGDQQPAVERKRILGCPVCGGAGKPVQDEVGRARPTGERVTVLRCVGGHEWQPA